MLHIYQGNCPDETNPDARDPHCPVCMAISLYEIQRHGAGLWLLHLEEKGEGCDHTIGCGLAIHKFHGTLEGVFEQMIEFIPSYYGTWTRFKSAKLYKTDSMHRIPLDILCTKE